MNKRIQNFLNACRDENVLVLYDSDLDGVCSATITLKALKKNDCQVKLIEADRDKHQDYINENNNFKFIIILDQAPGKLDIPTGGRVLVIDHHPSKDRTSRKLIHINPTFDKKVYQPTSYLAYKVFSEFFNLDKDEWIAVLGTTADYGYDDVQDLMDKYMDVNEKREIWDTEFGNAAKILGGAALDLGYEKILNAISTSKNLDSLLSNKNIKKGHKEYSIEYLRCKKLAITNTENVGKILFTSIMSKYKGITSHISSELSDEYPDKVIFVSERKDENVKISGRTQRTDVDLGKVMKKSTKSIGRGGGHPPAAGAMVEEDKFEKFKNNVIKEIN